MRLIKFILPNNWSRFAQTLSECQAALSYFEWALIWIGEYESQVLEELGVVYRQNAFANWGHQTPTLEVVPGYWNNLASQSRSVARFWHFENGKNRQIQDAH